MFLLFFTNRMIQSVQLNENKYFILTMSESIVKEAFELNFPPPISFYNIENRNHSNICEIEHHNENGTKPEEGSHIHSVLQNSTYEHFEVNDNKENEGSEEPMQIEDVEMKVREELEIQEELIDFTAGNDKCSQYDQGLPHNNTSIKTQIIYTGYKPYQYSHCDNSVSMNSDLIIHTTHTGKNTYKCSHCDKEFLNKSS
ncbi:unnamed protein product, partial [Meganyctiphanes norvegica]